MTQALMPRLQRPAFAVHDTFCQGKTGQGYGDDRVVTIPGFSAVFDGVSGPQGSAAADCAVEALKRAPVTATQREVIDLITAAMLARFGEPKPHERMPAATAAILSHERAEVWLIGDAQLVLVFDDHHEVHWKAHEFAWTEPLDRIRAMHNRLYLQDQGLTEEALYETDPGHDMLIPFRLVQHQMANVDGGYSVLCAKPMPDSLLRAYSVPRDALLALLMTDGYAATLMQRKDFLSMTELELAQSTISAFDPHCLGQEDPASIMPGNPGPKGIMRDPVTGKMNVSYDDRACVMVRVF